MRRLLVVLAVLFCWAPSAHAIDIDGKWGLGVGAKGVVGTDPEFSIFHGHSKTTGWLMDFRLSGADGATSGTSAFSDSGLTSTEKTNSNSNILSLSAGPRVRRFMRPNSDFSPYLDLFTHGMFSRSHRWDIGGSRDTRSGYGFDCGVAIGGEYFTRWHFSVAAHSSLATLAWSHTHDEREQKYFNGVSIVDKSSGHDASASFVLSPVLFLRTYF